MTTTRRVGRQGRYDTAALILLFVLLVAVVSCSPRLAKRGSTHPSFPLDAFAQPAYVLVFKDDDPVGNRTALELLRAAAAEQDSTDGALQQYGSSQGTADVGDGEQQNQSGQHARPFRAYLHRTSPTKLHICTLAKPRAPPEPLHRDEQGMLAYRAGVLNRALALLAPLKELCLFHTSDWFTYSLCYGDAIKQFHALPSTLGGGKTPTMDPSQDSYVLGRWRDSIERARGVDSDAHSSPATATVGDGHSSEAWHSEIGPDEQGSELMELVHFSSIEKPFLQGSGSHLSENSNPDYSSVEGKGRYVSQIWTDGTFCDLNNEPRTAEVQFHCAKSPKVDRISLIKEVTTCNYVVVVETPRLCDEPALAQLEDEAREVHCRPILSDEELRQRYMQNMRNTHASLLADSQAEASLAADSSTVLVKDSQQSPSPPPMGTAAVEGYGDFGADDTSLEAQLASFIKKLSATQRGDHADGSASLMDEVEVVVGMDEEGNFILEPRMHSNDADTAPVQGENSVGASGNDNIARQKLAGLLQKMQELQEGLVSFENQPSTEPQHGAGEQQPTEARRRDTAARAAHLQKYEAAVRDRLANEPTATGEQGAAGQNAQQVRRGGGANGGGPQAAPRGNMMVRETESFAQRVDRLYRAQEDKRRKAKEQHDAQTAAAAEAPAGNNHDEL